MREDISYYTNGNIRKKYCYNDNNQLHSSSGPASVEYWANGNLMTEYWYTDGVCYLNKIYNTDGSIQFEKWLDQDGKYHREGAEPALITYNKIITKFWYIHGFLTCNNNSPSVIDVDKDNSVVKSLWMITNEDGKSVFHRINGPAHIDHINNKRRWFFNGTEHTDIIEGMIEQNMISGIGEYYTLSDNDQMMLKLKM